MKGKVCHSVSTHKVDVTAWLRFCNNRHPISVDKMVYFALPLLALAIFALGGKNVAAFPTARCKGSMDGFT